MLASMIPKCECIADIGCDHGRLAVYALQNNICNRVIAVDISETCAAKAARLVRRCGLSQRCEIRVGNGMEVLKEGEAQVVVISGIGGPEIKRILAKGSADCYILQAMNHTAQVRRWLSCNCYRIIDEKICIQDNKFYEILRAERGCSILTQAECEFGPVLLKRRDPDALKYLLYRKNLLQESIEQMKNKHTPRAEMDRETLTNRLKMYDEAQSWLESGK